MHDSPLSKPGSFNAPQSSERHRMTLSRTAKRWFDILVGACLLILAAPLLVLCAVLIRLESPGPAFFRQDRIGRGFRKFRMIKLRTMYQGAEERPYTLRHDPRITPLGRWLRRLKIDECPQLWNVLRGDMSLVGPRPVIPDVVDQFPEEYAQLLLARPGLTDPASLTYVREDEVLSRSVDPVREFHCVVTPKKLQISLTYQLHATFWSDTLVLVATIWASITGRVPKDWWQSDPPSSLLAVGIPDQLGSVEE